MALLQVWGMVALLRLQHCMAGTLVLPNPSVSVCFGAAADLGHPAYFWLCELAENFEKPRA